MVAFLDTALGWTSSWVQSMNSTRCWKHSSEILVHIEMIAFFVSSSTTSISHSTTSKRCSIGLRSGDSGGHLSRVSSLSCSRKQFEIIWASRHVSSHQTMAHWCLKDARLVKKRVSKCPNKISPSLLQNQQSEQLILTLPSEYWSRNWKAMFFQFWWACALQP